MQNRRTVQDCDGEAGGATPAIGDLCASKVNSTEFSRKPEFYRI